MFTLPGTLNVRNLDDELIARLKRRAARHGRSAEAEHREILKQALSAEAVTDWWAMAAEVRALTAARPQTPSEDLQRESREERSAWLSGTDGDTIAPAPTPSQRKA